MIACGIPGAGKSTLASHLVSRWGAVAFESDLFRDTLGVDALRTPSGDYTDEALEKLYSAMADAVTASLRTNALVIAGGSFRSKDQRAHFRELASDVGASTSTIRIDASIEVAAGRVSARVAKGQEGPTLDAIQKIDKELNTSDDIDIVLTNNSTVEKFRQRIDTLATCLVWTLDDRIHAPSAFVERFEELAAAELKLARSRVEPERLRTWPPDRVSGIIRTALPNDVPIVVVPIAAQRFRIDVRPSYSELAVGALQEAGLRVAEAKDGLTVFMPALAPSARNQIVTAIEQELQLARDRIRELRNCLLLVVPRPFDSTIEASLQKATDKWVNAVDQLGRFVLSEITD